MSIVRGCFHSRNDILVRTKDGRNVVLQEPLLFVTEGGGSYRVPVGAESDGASIPHELWVKIPPFGDYWLAAVLHDAAYRGTLERQLVNGDWVKAMLSKEDADNMFLDAMMALGVDPLTRETLYHGVVHLGYRAFRTDRAEFG